MASIEAYAEYLDRNVTLGNQPTLNTWWDYYVGELAIGAPASAIPPMAGGGFWPPPGDPLGGFGVATSTTLGFFPSLPAGVLSWGTSGQCGGLLVPAYQMPKCTPANGCGLNTWGMLNQTWLGDGDTATCALDPIPQRS